MSLKIGILGTRGVPNYYGGFEHFAAHLSRGLADRGHKVTVYNSSRHPYQQNEWHSVEIVHAFDPEHIIGVAGQFIYDLNCIMHARKQHYDILLILGYTSSSVWKTLYPNNSIIITNMDGLEWKREKYKPMVRRFLKYAERLAVNGSHFHIADSPIIKTYLDNRYGINSEYIAYGADSSPVTDDAILQKFGLLRRQYFLLMARMEPENNVNMILEGFTASDSDKQFVVIGNTANQYGQTLKSKYKADKRIRFLGGLFEDITVQTITAGCALYFHGHSVGGTNPSLLDAMAARIPLAAHQNEFNHSTLENNACYFSSAKDVATIINRAAFHNARSIANNYNRILAEFTWERIITAYEQYFLDCYASLHQYHPVKKKNSMLYEPDWPRPGQ